VLNNSHFQLFGRVHSRYVFNYLIVVYRRQKNLVLRFFNRLIKPPQSNQVAFATTRDLGTHPQTTNIQN
jgi:hypothetical protein